MKIIQFLRNWTLPIAMLTGVAAYFIYTAIPQLDETHEFVSEAIAYIQPMLIFCMLFLTFCKIDPKSLRLTKWHLWLIMIQVCTFVLLGLPLIFCPENQYRVVLEGAMICMITPTATADCCADGTPKRRSQFPAGIHCHLAKGFSSAHFSAFSCVVSANLHA